MVGGEDTATTTGSASPPEQTIAAIDIGSNSIKMTVARRQHDGTTQDICWRSEVVRLGADIEKTGSLAEDRIALALDALGRFADEARALGASQVLAVATEATRAATNGAAFLTQVRNELGIDVMAIDGNREAELSFQGLAAKLDITGEVVVADIGGGSTELIYAVDGSMIRAGSIAVGSGRLTDRYVVADPPNSTELTTCRDHAQTLLQPLYHELDVRQDAEVRLILVGGTGEYFARLAPRPDSLNSADVTTVLDHLVLTPAATLAAELDIPEARARVLPAGIAVVAALVQLITPKVIASGQSGLRAGLLLEAFADLDEPRTEDTRR